jgi:hypothetical protein
MNPQHTVPTVKDGNFVLNESRPAAAYLVAKYGKNDKLYPKDPKVQVIVDQRMYFDMGTFYKAFADCVVIIVLSALPICVVSTANVTVNATCKCYSECPHLTPTEITHSKWPQQTPTVKPHRKCPQKTPTVNTHSKCPLHCKCPQ